MGTYTYLTINFLTILFPLIMSFEKKIFFFSMWKFVFPSMLIVGAFFILFDSFFTYLGVWGFNPDYVLGIYIYNLPIEEILFFLTVPFSCIFIYECVNIYLSDKIKYFKSNIINNLIIISFVFIGCIFTTKWYTAFAFIGAALYLIYNIMVIKSNHLGQFWMSYLLILIPFIVVNSILTGTFLSNPIVWYNNNHNLGIRILTIPVEDFAYNLLLVLMNITFYERFKSLSKVK